MKVGILTFPNSPSFGAALQMYGLYRALQSLGCEVEVINYRNKYISEKRHIRKGNQFKNFAISILDYSGKRSFRNFEKKMRLFPKKIINETYDLRQIADRYDLMICGSDQVWNPNITGEDLNYFFSFCKDNSKKISYAASFGVNELNENFAKAITTELKKFKSISVREERGAEIIYELLNASCSIVIDPTMLIEQDELRTCENKIRGLPSNYIAKFIFNYDKNIEIKIEELSDKTGLPVVTVGGTAISKLKKGLYTGSIGPSEWLYVLSHADYVVTDSFHGAVFSILFHKNLLVSMASTTNSRLRTLLHTFELDNRVITAVLPEGRIDYKIVQEIIMEKREESLDYLRNAIYGE